MIQFYAPDLAEKLSIPEDEAKHCLKVLRHRCGDIIEVIDGKGKRYRCRIIDDNPRNMSVDIVETIEVRPAWDTYITIAVAPTKNLDRMEWLIEKLTEIGINRFVPLLCRHSERKEIKVERLQRIAVSAMKQSLKAVLPTISPMTRFSEFINADNSESKFIAYCDTSIPRKLLAKEYKGAKSVSILIGPEGDFDIEEIKIALDSGMKPVTLGDNRLRTETAALTACDTIHVLNQLYY